jgi:hypothetical protein
MSDDDHTWNCLTVGCVMPIIILVAIAIGALCESGCIQ